jgi:hypothetical protein
MKFAGVASAPGPGAIDGHPHHPVDLGRLAVRAPERLTAGHLVDEHRHLCPDEPVPRVAGDPVLHVAALPQPLSDERPRHGSVELHRRGAVLG